MRRQKETKRQKKVKKAKKRKWPTEEVNNSAHLSKNEKKTSPQAKCKKIQFFTVLISLTIITR